MAKRKGVTAAELMARLTKNPEFQERARAIEVKVEAANDAARVAGEPILAELAQSGVHAASIDDLVKGYAPLASHIVRILIKHLPTVEHEGLREALVRALATAAQPFDGEPLIDVFARERSGSVRWALANSIAEARPYGLSDWIVHVVEDEHAGTAREMLIVALARLVPPETSIPRLGRLLGRFPLQVGLALAEIGGREELSLLKSHAARSEAQVAAQLSKNIDKLEERLRREKPKGRE